MGLNKSVNAKWIGVAAGLAVSLHAGASVAQCIRITESNMGPGATMLSFEVDGNGAPLANNAPLQTAYSALGVTFDNTDRAGGGSFISPPNLAKGDLTDFPPINATFVIPVHQVGAWGFDFEIEVFDAAGTSLGSGFYSADGIPGLFGGAAELAFLGLECTANIARVQFRHHFPYQSGYGFNIDDLMFFPGTACGDGTVQPNEECDDGNVDIGDGCDGSCQIEPCFACNESLAQCTSDLSQSSANLVQCNTDLSQCGGSLSDCAGDLAQANTTLSQCQADLGQASANLSACSASLGLCDGDLVACNGDLGACNNDLASTGADLGQCQTDLTACLTNGVVPDNDGDGEQDLTDACPDTLSAEAVDAEGCSQAEFCAKVDVTVRENRRVCRKLDWMNDEPTTGSPRDCEIDSGAVSGSADDICVPYAE